MTVEVMAADSPSKGGRALSFAGSMMLPAFRSMDGQSNSRGSTLVDKHPRNPTLPNIFAVGACAPIPPIGPVTAGVPKTGFVT